EPIRQRRHTFEQNIGEVYKMLEAGSVTARTAAAQTLNDVRNAMRINYFNDNELISSQAQQYQRNE
ncbi:MAG: tryptophan--tRNA ligase, partial [Alistipes sp.]